MKWTSTLRVAVLMVPVAGASAQEADCLHRFNEADTDRNGVIEQREDTLGLAGKVEGLGQKLIAPGKLSRDEFMAACGAGAFADLGPLPQSTSPQGGSGTKDDVREDELPKDLGKGDITPGVQKLPEDQARARLRANGFADVESLTLDSEGIWRGTAIVNGKRVAVAVDPQGDIIGGP